MDATAWDERYGASELVWSSEPNRFVADIIGPWPPGRALDLACGEGRNAIWLASRGWAVRAVDFSAVGVAKAAELAGRAGAQVDWVVADVVTDRPAPGAFDLVLISYLHLPVGEMTRVVDRAVDAVADGGALVVVAHARSNLPDGYGGPRDPAVLYDPDDLRAMIGDRLHVERAELVVRPVETDDGTREAIDLIVVAHRR